jgi:hypothetical protein
MKNRQLLFVLFICFMINNVQGQSNKPNNLVSLGLMNRLIQIKYNTELYLTINAKTDNKKDTALAIYNLIRWKMDGFIYQLSSDMITSNGIGRYRQLNYWSLSQNETQINTRSSKKIAQYIENLTAINEDYEKYIVKNVNDYKTLNLTTNVFYLIKDSWTVLKGMHDIKKERIIALIDLLDQTRLASPLDIIKAIK